MDKITPEAIDWALTHVKKYGDTDLFPIPFEYEAIAHDWNSIRPYIEGLDFASYRVRSDRRVFVLKPGGGFRAAIQLDPLDHLVYTSVVYEAAELIEKARIPADQKIACSYRIHTTTDGAFFQAESGWPDFHEHSKSLANSGAYSHVLLADISDFYNQLGQHRVQNALELATVSLQRSKSIEDFLNQLTAKQSQGLPVGPLASIVLAEACLIDVDNFLLRQGVAHVRYVDDFRVFCVSRKQAIEIRHALTEYLFTVHRLSLESSKSTVLYVERFIRDELSDPEEQEQQAKVEKLNDLLAQKFDEAGYWSEPADDEEELLSQAERESFVELFEQCVSKPHIHLGLARHLLRKALRMRTVILNDLVFDNFEALVPVMRDVVRYLAVTIPPRNAESRGRSIISFVQRSDLGSLPFVLMWLTELILRRPDLCNATDAHAIASEAARTFGIRPLALVAAAYKQLDWVRGRKETWRNHEPWDRRAVIWATSILPSGEKRPFLRMVSEQGDVLDAAIAKYLLGR